MIGRGSGNLYYLPFSHKLSRGIPASQLGHFYENQKYTSSSNGASSQIQPTQVDLDDDMGGNISSQDNSGQSDEETCQRVKSTPSNQSTSTPKKLGKLISSQILIISSNEMPLSSDDSSTIDVSTEKVPSSINPWGDMDIQDIPIKIFECLSDVGKDMEVTEHSKPPPILFKPLNDEDRCVAAMKFNLVVSASNHPVNFTGIGKACPCHPLITRSAKGNGACLFNTVSHTTQTHTMQSFIMLYATTYQTLLSTNGYKHTFLVDSNLGVIMCTVQTCGILLHGVQKWN